MTPLWSVKDKMGRILWSYIKSSRTLFEMYLDDTIPEWKEEGLKIIRVKVVEVKLKENRNGKN